MSRYSNLARRFRLATQALVQQAAALRLPNYLIYKPIPRGEGPGPHRAAGELLPEYREAAAEANRLHVPMKEYGFDPEALEREGIEELTFTEWDDLPPPIDTSSPPVA